MEALLLGWILRHPRDTFIDMEALYLQIITFVVLEKLFGKEAFLSAWRQFCLDTLL
jgi:hypothetical protein